MKQNLQHREDDDAIEAVLARFDAANGHYEEADVRAIATAAASMGFDELRADANETILFARQLDYVKARVYERKYPALMGGVMVPDSTEAPEYAETITTRVFDQVGIAKIVANYADDLPRADVRSVERTVRVRTIGDAYGYNINEVRASRAVGRPLDTMKARAARRAVEQKLNRIKFTGDADYNMIGLLNNPNVAQVVATTGNWSATATTGAQILADLNALYNAIIMQSNGIHRPNMLALPPVKMTMASSKPLDGMPGQTALSFWRQQHPEVRVEPIFEMVGAGAGGTDVAFLYELDEENLRHELVMPFNQLPPQARNLEFVVNCMARSAGVQIDYPLAFAKMEGI